MFNTLHIQVCNVEQVLYAEKNIAWEDDASHNLRGINIDSKDGDYRDPGNDDADDGSQSSAMEAGGKETGGNLKERAAAVLFQYSDSNYNHLYNEDIDKDEKRIKNSDSNKRVKVGCGRVNLIPGGPTPPNWDRMTADKADAAKKGTKLTARNSGRNSVVRDCKLRRVDCLTTKYMGDLTPTLCQIAQVINFHLKKGHTFLPDCDLIVLPIAEEANCRGISF